MTVGEMLVYTNRFKEISKSSSAQAKDIRLANLMTDLEVAYDIPMLRNEKFEMANPQLIQLYRTVSDERSL